MSEFINHGFFPDLSMSLDHGIGVFLQLFREALAKLLDAQLVAAIWNFSELT